MAHHPTSQPSSPVSAGPSTRAPSPNDGFPPLRRCGPRATVQPADLHPNLSPPWAPSTPDPNAPPRSPLWRVTAGYSDRVPSPASSDGAHHQQYTAALLQGASQVLAGLAGASGVDAGSSPPPPSHYHADSEPSGLASGPAPPPLEAAFAAAGHALAVMNDLSWRWVTDAAYVPGAPRPSPLLAAVDAASWALAAVDRAVDAVTAPPPLWHHVDSDGISDFSLSSPLSPLPAPGDAGPAYHLHTGGGAPHYPDLGGPAHDQAAVANTTPAVGSAAPTVVGGWCPENNPVIGSQAYRVAIQQSAHSMATVASSTASSSSSASASPSSSSSASWSSSSSSSSVSDLLDATAHLRPRRPYRRRLVVEDQRDAAIAAGRRHRRPRHIWDCERPARRRPCPLCLSRRRRY